MDKKSKDSTNVDLLKEEIGGFAKYLEEKTFLAQTSRTTYVSCIGTYLHRHETLSEENCMKFLKKCPRKYAVSALKHYAEYRGQVIKLPKIKEPPRQRRVDVSLAQVREVFALLEAGLKAISADTDMQKDIKYICEIRMWTSMRIREALRLRVEDLKPKDSKIEFRKKGGDFGENYLPLEFIESLYAYATEDKGLLPAEEIFFVNTKSGGDRAAAKYRLLRYYLRRAIPDENKRKILERTHILRRSVINEVGENSNDVYLASRIANHKNINTTLGYFGDRLKDAASRRALESLVENGRKN